MGADMSYFPGGVGDPSIELGKFPFHQRFSMAIASGDQEPAYVLPQKLHWSM